MKKLTILLLLVANIAVLTAQKVFAVHDGDSYKIATEQETKWYRIAGIDCPDVISNYITESQPFGQEVGDSMRLLLKGQDVGLQAYGFDVYNRPLASVFRGTEDVAEYMLKRGWAHYVPNKKGGLFKKNILPSGTRTRYANAEKYAKKNKLGVWSSTKTVTPEEWRKTHRRVQPITPTMENAYDFFKF